MVIAGMVVMIAGMVVMVIAGMVVMVIAGMVVMMVVYNDICTMFFIFVAYLMPRKSF
tara:strand:- start:30 stop:200 length:171 start_codon:yes stop_codon:yes gene_type:complete